MQQTGIVKSVWRAMKILESFQNEESMSVTQISKKLNFPKSSVYEILTTLVSEGIVEKDGDLGRYHLGIRLFELGNQARSNLGIHKIATPFLKELNKQFDETVHLTILDEDEVLYIECFESTKRLRTYSVIGVRAPLHCTGVGKAMMAFLPKSEIERIVRLKGLTRFTENTITDPKALMRELEKTAIRGFAVDNLEHEEGVRCIAAPIYNHEGKVFASISVSGPVQRIPDAQVPEIARKVVRATLEISKRLGYNIR